MNGNSFQPLGRRKTIRLAIGLTFFAWATQTLLHQWARGADLPRPSAAVARDGGTAGDDSVHPSTPAAGTDAPQRAATEEKFVPGSNRYFAGAVLELRAEATVTGTEVKLKQICRWSDADKAAFEPLAGLIVARVGANTPFRGVSVAELKQVLTDAGVNMGVIRFAGTTSCTVNRNDIKYDERTAMQQWIDARQTGADAAATQPAGLAAAGRGFENSSSGPAGVGAEAHAAGGSSAIIAGAVSGAKRPEDATPHTLRELLTANIAEQLGLPIDAMQLRFNPADEKVLNLSEPLFKFNVDGGRAHFLGNVAWDVTIVTETGTRKVNINAEARAWQDQLVLAKAVAAKQTLRDEDFIDRRVLVDHAADEPLASRSQVLGQMASRELPAGTLMMPRLVDPVPLVQIGQLVTITLEQGAVRIKTVARAMEGGSFGQSIHVRNESTRDVFEAVLTGPQQATMTANSPPAKESRIASREQN